MVGSKSVYLAGSRKSESSWRYDIATILNDQMDYRVIGPVIAPSGLLSDDDALFKAPVSKCYGSSDFSRYRTIASEKIVLPNIASLLKSDMVICYWDRMCGVGCEQPMGELYLAKLFDLPVFLVCDSIDDVPPAVIGCSGGVYQNFDELMWFLSTEKVVPKETQLSIVKSRLRKMVSKVFLEKFL